MKNCNDSTRIMQVIKEEQNWKNDTHIMQVIKEEQDWKNDKITWK